VLGSCYEEYVKEKNLDDVAVAYRKNKSNITGAKETFDFIWENGNSWIIKGDFSDFFDNLNHQILIKNVKKILNQYTDLKSLGDWLAVLKAITRYRVVRRSELKNIRKKNGKYTENLKQMRNCFMVGKFSISKANCKGIPQGTAMSAVLANVYMIEFDNCVQELLKTYSGFYRRYSDDFALVIPEEKCDFYEVKKISKEIKSLCTKRILLSIKTEKSELLHFVEKNKKIYNENTVLEKNFDFLGFSFTGKNVFLRSKTIYKYHYRGKHAIHLLIRNMNERDIASGKNYEKMKEVYIKSKPIKKQKMISERLDRIRQEVQSGYSLRGRKKITCMYLVNRPIRMKNMAYYADLAQKQLSVPIPGIKTLYGVKVKSKITKKIGQFQKIFGKLKKTRNYL
ncbi:MAG: reverse transcriptase/maturase family protein, partial [Liquorilactobacillus satsumensis]|uniref:reverse transcriptase/maturase family protein n=1 Tax=Liquorilactobacillus satsumensis TaxID=259059 RepID=UPI0039EA0343